MKIKSNHILYLLLLLGISLGCSDEDPVDSAKSIISFKVPGATDVRFNATKDTIFITLPKDFDLSSVRPNIEKISYKMQPEAGAIIDLSQTKRYLLTAQDGSSRSYALQYRIQDTGTGTEKPGGNVDLGSNNNRITELKVSNVDADLIESSINNSSNTIEVFITDPEKGDLLKALEFKFTTPAGSTISYGGEALNLEEDKTITVTAANGEKRKYTLTAGVRTAKGFARLISQPAYEKLFPLRYGSKLHFEEEGIVNQDFYSYAAMRKAMDDLSKINIKIYKRLDTRGQKLHYTYRIDRTVDGVTKKLIVGEDYNKGRNSIQPEVLDREIDYEAFANVKDLDKDRKELSAFLAQISHETTGGRVDDINKVAGLYFIEEVAYTNGNVAKDHYHDSDPTLPADPNQSYHGRGPMQLSWNTNYAIFSFVAFGDEKILLKNPGKVIEDGQTAFMAAIHFWMFPVGAKPSCHDVIHQDRGFAKTINIINGGLECGKDNSANDNQVLDRIGYYKQYYETILGKEVPESDTDLSCRDIENE